MDRRLPISPIPDNLRKKSDGLKEPYGAENYQGTKSSDRDRFTDRTYHSRRDDDDVGNIKVSLMDIDSVIPYYFDNIIKPTVIKDGTLIEVPVIYGAAEIWKTVQKDGYYRDKESKIQVPLIMFKRTSITKRKDIGNKLDGNQVNLFQVFEKTYSRRNQYDNFNLLNNRSPEKEYHAVVVPDYVDIKYDFIIWTEYVENMNKLIENINFASDSYWGDPERWKFKASIDSFNNQTEIVVGGNRSVRTSFTLTLNGYLIPDSYNKALANQTKFSNVTNINFTDEQFTLQTGQSTAAQVISTFTTKGPGSLAGGSASPFPFTGNAVINGNLTVIGTTVDFTGVTNINGSTFSGSFIGDGSGLTGIASSSFATFATSASYAISASHEIIKEVSSSHADFADTASLAFTANTASYVDYTNIDNKPTLISSSTQIATEISGAFTSDSASFSTRITTNETNITSLTSATSSYVLTSQTSSMTVLSSSLALTASYVANVVSSSYALTASYAENAGGGAGFPFSGSAVITGSLEVSGSGTNILTIQGSGSANPLVTIQGSSGELFTITDSLSGSLFAINNSSGNPIFEVYSDNKILYGDSAAPTLTTTVKNTVSAVGSFTVYSLPTSSYDGAFFKYVAKSGSDARAGEIMSLWSGTTVNFTETTTRDFGDTSALSFNVVITGSNFALTGSATTPDWTIKTIVRSI